MDLEESNVGLEVANQNIHVATDKNQQVQKPSTSQPQLDSGCYSIDPPTCDPAQNGRSLSKGESENDGREEQQDNIVVKESEAVVTELPSPPQPCEVEDDIPSFPVSGPPISDNEGTLNNVQEMARPILQGIPPENAVIGTPHQDSHHNSSGETLRVSSDRIVSVHKTMEEPNLEKLHSRNVAVQEKFKAIETRMHEKRYTLVQRGKDVDRATLQKLVQETCQEMSEDMKNLQSFAEMIEGSTSSESSPNIRKDSPDLKDTKAVQTNLSASTTSSPNSILILSPSEDQCINTPVEEQREEDAKFPESDLKGDKKPEMSKDDASESMDMESKNTPGHNTEDLQEEANTIGTETLDLHYKKDPGQMQQHSDSPKQREEVQSVEPLKEQLGDSASNCGPSDSCKNKNKQPPAGQGWDDMSTEDQDRKKQAGDKVTLSDNEEKKAETDSEDKKEDRVLPNQLLISQSQAEKEKKSPEAATNCLEKKAKSEEPSKNVLPSNTQEKRGQPEEPVTKLNEVLSNNLTKEGHQDKDKTVLPSSTHEKKGKLGEPVKSGVLPNKPTNEGHHGKGKTGVPSNTKVKRGQSEEPVKNVVLPNSPTKEDSPDYKDKTAVKSNTEVKMGQSEQVEHPLETDLLPKKQTRKGKAEDSGQNDVPFENVARKGKEAKKRKEDKQERKTVHSHDHELLKKKKQVERETLDATQVKQKGEGRATPKDEQKDQHSASQNYQLKMKSCSKLASEDCSQDGGQESSESNMEETNCCRRVTPKQKRSCSLESLAQDEDIVENQEDITHLKKVSSQHILPQNEGDTTTKKEAFVKAENLILAEKQNQLVSGRKQEKKAEIKGGDNKSPTNLKDECLVRLNEAGKKYDLIVWTPENTSSHEEGDKILLEDTKTLKEVKNWMNLKLSTLLAFLSFLFDFLMAWSHKEEPPDVTSYHKSNTTPVPVDHDALIYNVQRQDDEDLLGDSSDEDGEEEQDGYNQPEWLAQDDNNEDEDLYLGSEDTIAFPGPGEATGPLFCSEVPENGQMAVGGGASICPFNHQSHIGDHPSQHLPTTSAQGLPNGSDMSLEEVVERYRRTERGITVTVLGLGEQIVSQTRVYDPTTLQEHVLEHTADEAFAKYPMDGFTVKLPGGRTVPLEMSLDPWRSSAQNIILQLHQANYGDCSWQWRVTHSENPDGGRYSVEVNMHSVLRRRETRDDRQPTDHVETDRVRGESGLLCCICQDTESGLLVETSCRHTFHEVCLFKWLEERDVCPLCWEQDPLQ